MIRQIRLENFKCFETLRLSFSSLTLLSGSNSSGKSSILQALVLLHQSMLKNEWASRLMLNGGILKMGTMADVVDKIHGRHSFGIAVADDEHDYYWHFSSEDRVEMSAEIERIEIDEEVACKRPLAGMLRKLLPMQNTSDKTYPVSDLLASATYITAERLGPREFYNLEDREKASAVGPTGEHTASILYSLQGEEVDECLALASAPPTLLRQAEARMQQFFPGCGLALDRVPHTNGVTLRLRTSRDTDHHRPIHVGFGLTQILPIIVATLSAKPNNLLLIENPEVHLHPASQALMGAYLAEVANAGAQIVIETHSDHVLNGIRRAVKRKAISSEQVALYFFRPPSDDLDQVASPQLDQEGNIDFWPEGFFDQFEKDINHFAGWGE